MIPPSSASDRLTSILGNAEWVVRRNERANDPFAGRERASVREESNKLVWSGTLSLARRGRGASDDDDDDDDDDDVDYDRGGSGRVTRASRAATRSRSEAVDETAGTTSRACESVELGGGGSSAVASDADASDMDERPVMEEIVTRGARGGESSSRRAAAPRTIACQLVAQGPPATANIPGTARGEGAARANAAGSALPEIVHAECVAPGDDGWPEVWDPVALLRLFPSSAHHATAFRRIHALLADCRSDHTKSDDPESVVPAAARMDLPDGYVLFVVSDTGLPDIVRDAVGLSGAGEKRNRKGDETKKPKPLWAIIQSAKPLAAPQPLASVPTPDVKPTRGILRGWVRPTNEKVVVETTPARAPEHADGVRMPEELSGVHPSVETMDEDEKSLSSAHEMTSRAKCEGMGTVTPVLSEDTSELTSGTSEVERVTIKIGGDDELDDWLSPPLARRKRKSLARSSSGFGSDGENSDDSSGREFAKLKRTATSPTASPSSSEGEEELVPMEGQHEIPTSAAAIEQVISPEQRVPCVPLTGLRYMLLGFEVNHPHVVYLIKSLAEEGASYVHDPNTSEVDLIVVHPPFLQLLSAPQFPVHVSAFIRSRRTRFALGLRHLELCLEHKRRLDPRLETAEVFPEGVLVVMDDTALINDDDALHRIVRLLAQAAAASAAAAAAKGIFHYGQDGARENPPWPWAIKVANSTIQKLMMTKLRMMQTNKEKAMKIDAMIKSLHAYKHAGDRAGRGARVMGITWEEASHQPVEDPPQAVRDAVKIASRHVSMCRAVFVASEDETTLVAAKRHSSILSGSVNECCDFLTHTVREMWAETKDARMSINVHDSNMRKLMSATSEPSVSEAKSNAVQHVDIAGVEEEVSDGARKRARKKVVKFPTTIDDGGQSTRSRGRYSPPPSPTRTNSGRTGDDTSKDTSKTSTGDAPTDGEETAQSPIVPKRN